MKKSTRIFAEGFEQLLNEKIEIIVRRVVKEHYNQMNKRITLLEEENEA